MNPYGYTAERWPEYAYDLRLEELEEANCRKCKGLEECANSFRGGRQVVAPYNGERPERRPVTAVRRCGYWMRNRSEEAQRRLFSASGMGEHFWDRTFGNFVPSEGTREALEEMTAYAGMLRSGARIEGKPGRLIIGPVGVGKTHLAAAAMGTAIGNGMSSLFCPAPVLMTRYASSFQSRDTQQFLDGVSACGLLVIDDMGKEKDSDTARVLLFQIVNGRYEQGLPLIVTTNMTAEEIGRDYGEATLSRLKEMCALVVMRGEDHRTNAPSGPAGRTLLPPLRRRLPLGGR